jgi:hypothetical protein
MMTNEDAQDDEPIVTSNDLVLRSGHRNLQPLIDAGIESKYVSKLRSGKRLTLAELNIVKSRTKLMEDGSLVAQGAIEDGYIDGYVSDPEWAARLKTWRQLNKLGRFDDVARQAGVPVQVIEDAARYGNYDDKYEDTDWGSIQAAINVLTGRTKRQTKLKRARQKAGERKENHRSKRKVITLLNEIQTADFVVFPTDIETDVGYDNTPVFDEIDARVLRRELRKSAETYNKYMSALNTDDIMSVVEELGNEIGDEFTSPAVEYWEPGARRIRAKAATALRVARHRERQKNDAGASTYPAH